MSELDFAEFFEAVQGFSPLPWQTRLANRLTEGTGWPSLIDLPTASGKTACIDIAVFHLAWCAAHGEPWRAARRIALVVDRRIIVDAAFERAERIRIALNKPQREAIRLVAEALKTLGGEASLCCHKLRGGMPRERGFALHPAQPMVITSTIDQIGSRLLFRGYGQSQYAHPVNAGLLGHDTLILLDEAHLGEPFIETVAAIQREQARATRQLAPLRPVQLVSLSATGRTVGERFQLEEGDLAHPAIDERRRARKIARLVETTSSASERLKTLLRETLVTYADIDSTAPSLAVIVNRVKTARDLFTKLLAHPNREFDVKLVTGRSRPLDRDAVAKHLVDRAAAGRKSSPEDKGLIVVATQALEVGADLDFQGLVTECASIDALRQRFGRLDRLGRFKRSKAVIVGESESEGDPIYGQALLETWLWLKRIARPANDQLTVDFSIAEIEAALSSVDIPTLSVAPRETMQLTPAHVELLSQTSPRPMYEPDVGALLHGFQAEQSEVQVVWRSNIPLRRENDSWTIDREEKEWIDNLLTIIPPSSLEALSLPRHAVKAWLTEAPLAADMSDLEGVPKDSEADASAAGPVYRQVWLQTAEGWKASHPSRLRPGNTIVVPIEYGGCDEFGFAPGSEADVSDLSMRARQELERESILVLTLEALRRTIDPERADVVGAAWRAACDSYTSEKSTPEELLRDLLDALGMVAAADLGSTEKPTVETLAIGGSLRALILRSGPIGIDDISDDDLSSSRTRPVPLYAHNSHVGERARVLAKAVRLDEYYYASLGCAGGRHDLGKADPRFQSLLRAGDSTTLEGQLLAKGLRHVGLTRVELPERHEAYSIALLKAYPDLLKEAPDPELALYLVGTHHGRGRALMPDRFDEGTQFEVVIDGQALRFDGVPCLGALGSGWPSLFWRLNERYGAWGLAYLEALLRLADQLQSRAELDTKE